jgi:hypothetical protein
MFFWDYDTPVAASPEWHPAAQKMTLLPEFGIAVVVHLTCSNSSGRQKMTLLPLKSQTHEGMIPSPAAACSFVLCSHL